MFREILELFHKDSLLDQSLELARKMLEEGREMFNIAMEYLRNRDTAVLPFNLREKDKLVNHMQQEIRANLLTHLCLRGTKDINPAMVLAAVVIDLERIGDYTKNIAELAEWHPQKLAVGEYAAPVEQSEEQVRDLFDGVIAALHTSSENIALDVLKDHQKFTQRCDDILRRVIAGDDQLSKPDAISLALYIRFVKRVGAHLTNVASSFVNPYHRIGFKPTDHTED